MRGGMFHIQKRIHVMKLYDSIIKIVEGKIAPIAVKVGNQKHIRAMRDGFIVAMPFIIVGSFMLVFAFPPFAEDTENAFGRAWLNFAAENFDNIMLPYEMTMGLMAIFVSMGIGYSLARAYNMDGITSASLSLMTFLVASAPVADGALSTSHLSGTGIFTSVISAFFSVELIRILNKYNVTIRLPEQVPPAIARSFEILIPVLFVFLTVYPLSLFFQIQINPPSCYWALLP